MEGTVESVETVEATIVDKGGTSPVPQTAPVNDGFSGKSGDLMADLALLAKQQEAPKETVSQPEPVQPEATATAPETQVPEKFQNPDGTVNQEKVEKSTFHAKKALAEYAELERQLRQKQAEGSQLKQPTPAQPTPAPVVANVPLSPLEQGIAQDLINEAAAQGLQLDPKFAVAHARVMAKGLDAKYAAELNVTADIRERIEVQERQRELESIAENDPWVFSPEGIKALSEIRQSRPHVNASRTPWTAAYREFLADQAMSQRLGGQVQTPTPKATTAKAPPTPVGAAPRAVVKPSTPQFDANIPADKITEYVKTLDPKAEAAFWAARGLKF